MKLSHNWLRDYLIHDLSTEKIAYWLTEIGLEVEGVEELASIKGGLRGVVTGKVIACEKHPNADKLSLTKIDIGQSQLLNIVCGAPNVAVNQHVLVATVGTTLYDKEGMPWTIKEAKVRGEISQGMLCAEDELGLGNSHDGIMVLPDETPIGLPAAELFEVQTDEIFELGLTPNRADANSHVGTARDLWAALHIHEGLSTPLIFPQGLNEEEIPEGGNFDISILDSKKCPRYTGMEISGVRVGESPDWLKNRLLSIGQKPVNNIVDITNFVMFELGQPLHAFDADRITQKRIIIGGADPAKPFTGLDGQVKSLIKDDLAILSADLTPMCIAGVYGAEGFGVNKDTTNVFLESACFDPATVRRSSLRHNLRTESAAHFEKGIDPGGCKEVLLRAAALICELCGGKPASQIYDLYPEKRPATVVKYRPERINHILGKEIPVAEQLKVLKALQMEVEEQAEGWMVKVPGYKIDVLREIDLAEEVARIYGLNHIAASEQFKYGLRQGQITDNYVLREKAFDFLAAAGYNETMSLSIINSEQWHRWSGFDRTHGVLVNNTSNVHLDLMRPSLLPSVLESIAFNTARQQQSLHIYEFGREYLLDQGAAQEVEKLAIAITGAYFEESWQNSVQLQSDIYLLKAVVINLLEHLGIENVKESLDDLKIILKAGKVQIARLFRVEKSILLNAGIKQDVYYADIDWQAVELTKKNQKTKLYTEFSKYPVVRRDLALVMDEQVNYGEIVQVVKAECQPYLQSINLFDEYRSAEHLGPDKKSYAVSLILSNPVKTWSDKELEALIKKVTDKLKQRFNIIIRK